MPAPQENRPKGLTHMTAPPTRRTADRGCAGAASGRRLRRGAALLAAAAAAALLGTAAAPAALAHDQLISSDPEDGAELDTAPSEILLTFSADIGDGGNAVVVNGPDGTDHAEGSPEVDGPDATVPVGPLTEAGEYTVAYRMVSSDGHVVEDDFAFTLTDAAVAGAEEAGSEASPAAEEGSGSGSDAAGEQPPSSDPVSLFGPVGGVIAGIAGVAVIAVVAITLWSRSRQNRGGDGDSGPRSGSEG